MLMPTPEELKNNGIYKSRGVKDTPQPHVAVIFLSTPYTNLLSYIPLLISSN